jgi:hypothetical protein
MTSERCDAERGCVGRGKQFNGHLQEISLQLHEGRGTSQTAINT